MYYKSQLKAYSNKQFDPFCRRERILLMYDDEKNIITTCGQLNFFRWVIENNILNYVESNIKDIEDDMYVSLKKKNKKKKRTELSQNASKNLQKINGNYTVKW